MRNTGRGDGVVPDVTGVFVVLAVLVAASTFGVWRGRHDGRVRPAVPDEHATVAAGASATADDGDGERLSAGEIGAELGERATLVQFSSAFCQPCRATRATLAHVAGDTGGVVHVEIDAEANLDLVRRLSVLRTPTTLVLDRAGRIVGRASGAPRLHEVRAALPA